MLNLKWGTIPNTDAFGTILRRFREQTTFIRRHVGFYCRIRILDGFIASTTLKVV